MSLTDIVKIIAPGAMAAGLLLAPAAYGDLTPSDFPHQPGELSGRAGWSVQRNAGGLWVPAEGIVEVRPGGVIAWQAGYGGKEQVRAVKMFPSTVSDKAVVRFSWNPGSDTVGGRLYLGQSASEHVTALQFLQGRLWVMERERQEATDTGVVFQPDDWNHFEMRFDFIQATVEVRMNEESVGTYEIPREYTSLGMINFFGGGAMHESQLKELTVVSVNDFSEVDQ